RGRAGRSPRHRRRVGLYLHLFRGGRPPDALSPPDAGAGNAGRRQRGGRNAMIASMEALHISEADAVRDLAAIRADAPARRTISECIALAQTHERESGQAPVLDADFAADVEEIVGNRKRWNPPTWD